MAFTYDLESADPDDLAISQVRFQLGDTQLNRGVRANGINFTDVEVLQAYDGEGQSVMRTVAGLCEMLSRDWARVASTSVGPRSAQYGTIAEQYAKRAAELRTQYGGASTGYAFSISPIRVDGYSANASESEYG